MVPPPALFAICIFQTIGWLNIHQTSTEEPLVIKGNLTGLSPGKHGMHIHSLGNTLNNCTMAGDHFNPWQEHHGGPSGGGRHAGDLGNIEVNEVGTAVVDGLFENVSLYYPTVMGRAIVIHEGEDDEGKGPSDQSKVTGNSGGRKECCVIALDAPFMVDE